MPMHLMRWIVPGGEPPSPMLVFYTLRILFFLISFVLGMSVLGPHVEAGFGGEVGN